MSRLGRVRLNCKACQPVQREVVGGIFRAVPQPVREHEQLLVFGLVLGNFIRRRLPEQAGIGAETFGDVPKELCQAGRVVLPASYFNKLDDLVLDR